MSSAQILCLVLQKCSEGTPQDGTRAGSFQLVFKQLANKHYNYMPFVAAYTDGGVDPTEDRPHSLW